MRVHGQVSNSDSSGTSQKCYSSELEHLQKWPVCPRILWKIHSELKRTPSRVPHPILKLNYVKNTRQHIWISLESQPTTLRGKRLKGCEFWNWNEGREAKAHTALTRNWSDFQNSFLELTHSCLPVTPTPGTWWRPWDGMSCVSLEHTHTRQTGRLSF